MIITIVVICLVIWSWITIRINRRKDDEQVKKWEQEDGKNDIAEMNLDWDIGEEEIKKRLN